MTHGAGETAAEASPHAFAARMALLYSAMFSFAGLMLPFFPLWLKDRGLDATQIALVLSLPLAVR
ncbi:MAG: MFS transporter, partial [Nitratireductor sp.]|nr:MFS transporter [Nitratireductor sp.]